MGENIRLTADDGFTFDAYQARPEGRPRGGIVVVQEIFGVNNNIRRDADKFAREGYVAVAPAFFDRVEKKVELAYDQAGMDKGREIVGKLGIDPALRDVRAAANYLTQFGKVGVVGYCWGGSIAWASATRLGLPAVGFYGGRIVQLMHERPQAPVELHFGAKDHHIPMGDVGKIRYVHQDVPIYIYEAGHGFTCEDRADFDRAANDLSFTRTRDFFAKHLA